MKRVLLFFVVVAVLVVGLSRPAADPKPSPSPEEVQLCAAVGKLHIQRCAQSTLEARPDFDPKSSDPKNQYLAGSCIEGGVVAQQWCLEDRSEYYVKKHPGDDCAAGREWHQDIFAEGRKRFEARTDNQSGREDSEEVEKHYLSSWDRFCAKFKANEADKNKVTQKPFESPSVVDL